MLMTIKMIETRKSSSGERQKVSAQKAILNFGGEN